LASGGSWASTGHAATAQIITSGLIILTLSTLRLLCTSPLYTIAPLVPDNT
jgi:hypothetical protein